MGIISDIKALLHIPKDIAIISHRNPDGDAIGSSLGLRNYLEKLGHSVKVVLPSEFPSTFSFLKRSKECIIFDLNREEAFAALEKAHIIFCLDFNSLDRVDKMGNTILESKATKILIDHHMDPEPFADYAFSESSASSTCELVYTFIEDLGDVKHVDLDLAECLMTGIITDTGTFKYSTNPRVYAVAGKLKALGADDYNLNDLIYNTQTEKQLRLLGHCLSNRLEVIPEYQTGIITLTKEDYLEFQIGRGDTEGIVNQILMMKGIRVAAFIREQPTIIKLSLRSKGDISVQEIASNHFNGGGHKNASGGSAYARLDDIVKRFKSILPKYIQKVQL